MESQIVNKKRIYRGFQEGDTGYYKGIKGKISIKIIKIKVLVALIATVMDTLQRLVLRKGDKGKSTR